MGANLSNAEGQLENVGGSLAPSIRWIRDRSIERARAAVGETSFESARTEGACYVVRTGDCLRASRDTSTRLNQVSRQCCQVAIWAVPALLVYDRLTVS